MRAAGPQVRPGAGSASVLPGMPARGPEASTGALPAAAAVLAQARSENFPVASRILPRHQRTHLMAIYGFARLVDDTGDEAPGDRLALLEEIERDLDRVYLATPRLAVLRALVPTVRACGLPREPFAALIEANRRDQQTVRYATWSELLDYCRLSANPVGRLVLQVFGAATPERVALSDCVCTALQLVEHWQDVGEDRRRGRVYLPAEDLDAFGVRADDLDARAAGPALRSLLAFETARTADLLDRGTPLVATLHGRSRLAVGGFVAGGRAALAALTAADFDVLAGRPRPTRGRLVRELAASLARRA